MTTCRHFMNVSTGLALAVALAGSAGGLLGLGFRDEVSLSAPAQLLMNHLAVKELPA